MSKNHIQLANELGLFFFDDTSPGSCFWLPRGAIIYNKLMDFLRGEYKKYGYQEVVTPNIFDKKLWMISGHWDKYQENMFLINKKHDHDEDHGDHRDHHENKMEFSLKPMNCPSHCVMYSKLVTSYRDLPIRLADFGVLHRNELSGTLRGLTRVRRFQQDDAHIFCRYDQINGEIKKVLEMLRGIYDMFGFEYYVEVSTRPEEFIGTAEQWKVAEEILIGHATQFENFEINAGDGAFYGPKIDISIRDSLSRNHQCGTIQLDFNLPERFDLKYATEDGFDRPVIIHRAIFGSLERFTAILLEHTQGHLPFWLSPRQIVIIPVTNKLIDGVREIAGHFSDYLVDIDESDNELKKKIAMSQIMKYNWIFVVGQREIDSGSINIRGVGMKTIEEALDLLKQ